MSCKYKSGPNSLRCKVIHEYCQYQTMDDTCPILNAYPDFDKYIDGKDDEEVVYYDSIVGAEDSTDFAAIRINLHIGKNN